MTSPVFTPSAATTLSMPTPHLTSSSALALIFFLTRPHNTPRFAAPQEPTSLVLGPSTVSVILAYKSDLSMFAFPSVLPYHPTVNSSPWVPQTTLQFSFPPPHPTSPQCTNPDHPTPRPPATNFDNLPRRRRAYLQNSIHPSMKTWAHRWWKDIQRKSRV